MMQIVGAFAEFEREMLRQRTRLTVLMPPAGKDVSAGAALSGRSLKKEILKLIKKGLTAAEAARLFRVHPATISRLLQSNKSVSKD